MLTAALDTSLGCAFAVKDDDLLLIDNFLADTGRDNDRRLTLWLMDLLAQKGLAPRDIAGWTAGIGPGSFAGLRCGIALLKGFCLVSGARLRGLPTPLAIAAAAPFQTGIVGILNDGRCGQVILSRVELQKDKPPRLIEPPQPLDPEALASPIRTCNAWLTLQADRLPKLPTAIADALVRLDKYSAAPLLDDQLPWPNTRQETEDSTTPIYVRPPVFVSPSPIATP